MIEFFFALPNSKQSTLTSSATRILSAPPKSKPLQANIFPPIRRPRQTPYVIVIVILFLLYLLHFHHGLGVERTPPTPLGYAVAGGRQVRRSSVSWGRQGMATLLPSVGQKAEHPIYEFMERAEERWRNLLASQSTTLTAAVDEYKRRYQLPPPAGFEYWFAFCKTRGIRIIDDYDQLMKDILPHHALLPAVFLARSQALDGKEFTYTLRIDQEEVKITGDRSGPKHFRPHEQRKLIDGFRHALPPGFRLNITASDHDISGEVLGKDQRQRAMELVRAGQHFDKTELQRLEDPLRTPAFGWSKACPLDSPANVRTWSENATKEMRPKSFIYDHLPTMDFCDFPELKHLHGNMYLDYEDRAPSKLEPIMALSKYPSGSSFQYCPTEGYYNATSDESDDFWHLKTDNRLFWRGSTTGGFGIQRDWKQSHRMRLHLMMNGPKGGDATRDKLMRELLVPNGRGGFEVVSRREKVLSRAYADVKLSGELIQCPEGDLKNEILDTIEFSERMQPAQAFQYKYNLDVDGNGWSSRFHRLLSDGSPVIKFTMFPEWHMEWLTPWLHYIPLKPDYSDLYDIMAFFAGPIDENGMIDESKGHDYLARKIGEAGRRFAIEHWSWQDMQAYTFRLLLELRRLHSLDRKAMSYKEPVE